MRKLTAYVFLLTAIFLCGCGSGVTLAPGPGKNPGLRKERTTSAGPAFWAAFESDAEDLLLFDFEKEEDLAWTKGSGPKSEISFEFATPENGDVYGTKVLKVDYRMADYADVMYEFDANGRPEEQRDWSKHWGLRFSFHTTKPYQAVTVQVSDAGNEIFVCNVGGRRGWNEVLVPFRGFNKFPYYQPPDAEQNGHFDLEGIRMLDFKPAGEGTKGSYRIDNIYLTNTREIEKPEAPEQAAVAVTGELSETVTEKIEDGIFGINVALWDGDLLKPKTAEYVGAVNHGVLRYPGGLRADEDHWEEVLARKDWMVDTDEFIEFCTATSTTAMITVNFGRGTPEEAARWVEHVNIKSKAGVRYWEVGNELYGDWHANHCTAEEYGKRAAEFIAAMKAVDSTILVGVVWVLEGAWNREVFEYTRDLADAVIVHHYPQHTGQENDFALLASPQSLDDILPSVRKQLNEYGAQNRDYEIWLTEWNSVDFGPGPQTLSVVNGLFVIDYLGTLAEHTIEQASYWDVHNDLTPQGGDYGYLSRTGATDGDNVPRPSYWAFRLASEAIRGRLAKVETDTDNVTAYLAEHEDGSKWVVMVNKMPETEADVTLSIPGFTGDATLKEFRPDNASEGLDEKTLTLEGNDAITIPAHSAVSISIR